MDSGKISWVLFYFTTELESTDNKTCLYLGTRAGQSMAKHEVKVRGSVKQQTRGLRLYKLHHVKLSFTPQDSHCRIVTLPRLH